MQRLDALYILTLGFVPKLGKATLHRILGNLEFKPSNLKELCEVVQPFIKLSEDQLEIALSRAEHTLSEHEKAGINIVGIDDPEYPQQLRTISNPPLVLYAKGNTNCLKPELSIAVIGTRQPTDYGRRTAERIAKQFAEQGLIVVSGLAQGCDTAGHQGCLQGKGCTVAVLAHGLDTIYPSQNRELVKKIVDTGGCLVSEYPIGNKPFKNQFVERDRIQSGLSSAVVIVETDIKGGTMHTARFCLEQRRVLACIDYAHKHHSDKSRGNEKLISEGKAIPLKNQNDLKNFIRNTFGNMTTEQIVTEVFSSEKIVNNIEVSVIEKVESQKINSLKEKTENQSNAINLNKPKNNKSKENLVTQLSLPIDVTNIIENSKDFHSINNILNSEELAKRLNVSKSTLNRQKRNGSESFKEWSRKKDPDGYPWEYSEKTKLFEVVF